jgi:hypothetical protein
MWKVYRQWTDAKWWQKLKWLFRSDELKTSTWQSVTVDGPGIVYTRLHGIHIQAAAVSFTNFPPKDFPVHLSLLPDFFPQKITLYTLFKFNSFEEFKQINLKYGFYRWKELDVQGLSFHFKENKLNVTVLAME